VVDHAVRRRDLPTHWRALAPTRLDFAGAWTDVPPFSAREGGMVVNAAITLSVTAELELGGELIRLVSEDLSQQVECVNSGGLISDGRLDIHKAALRMLPVLGNLTLTTRSQAPPGAGLGSSGALDTALVAVLAAARQERVDRRDLAEYAWRAEVIEAGIPGGRQDQLAAAFGGFHRFSFRDPDVGLEPLTLDAEFAAELERRLLVCYTGRSRVSGDTIARVMGAYERGDRGVTGALRALKDVAAAMAEALRAADLARVGALLEENWRHQQALDAGMRTEEMARLEAAMADRKALGGKAAGAGAGGTMFFLVPGDRREAERAAAAAGATVLPVGWATEGVRVW
jgi:D-glycero-alpha-D-manno-heptose-7-phosphate kinase